MTRDDFIDDAREFVITALDDVRPPFTAEDIAPVMVDHSLEHEKRVRAEIAGELRELWGGFTSDSVWGTRIQDYIAKLESPDTEAKQ